MKIFFGGIIIVFGILFLFQNLGIITYNFWGIFWPIVIIMIGMKFLKKKGHMHWCCGHGEKGDRDR